MVCARRLVTSAKARWRVSYTCTARPTDAATYVTPPPAGSPRLLLAVDAMMLAAVGVPSVYTACCAPAATRPTERKAANSRDDADAGEPCNGDDAAALAEGTRNIDEDDDGAAAADDEDNDDNDGNDDAVVTAVARVGAAAAVVAPPLPAAVRAAAAIVTADWWLITEQRRLHNGLAAWKERDLDVVVLSSHHRSATGGCNPLIPFLRDARCQVPRNFIDH